MSNGLPNSIDYIYAYIRRSRQDLDREKKTKEDTLTEQRTLLTRILKERYMDYDWKMYEEMGSGADAIEDRPVFRGICEELAAVKPFTKAIFIKDISRLGRGSYEQMGFLEKLIIEKCIFIITPYQIYDPMKDEDIEYIKFNMFMANMEYGRITKRMREARYNFAYQGKWVTGGGGIPYGYKLNPQSIRLEPDEETAPVVQRIFDLYVNGGVGYNAISTILEKEGILTASKNTYWKPMVIRRMLRNPVYIGTVRFRTTRTRGKQKIKLDEKDWIIAENGHPPLVSKEMFEAAERKMEENKQSPKVRLDFEPTPLASLIVCSSCGTKMQRQYSTQHYKKKDGEVSVYKKEFMMCLGCSVYMKYNDIEEEILRILEEEFIAVDKDVLKEKLDQLLDLENLNRSKKFDPANRIQVLEKQLSDLNDELTKLRRMLRKELITEEEYEEDRADILRQKEENERQLQVLKQENKTERIEQLDIDSIHETFQSLLHEYKFGELSKGEKNELLRGLFDYIVLEKTGKGRFNLHAMLNPNLFFPAL